VKLGEGGREIAAAAGVTAELVSFRNFLSTTSPPVQRRLAEKLDLPISERAARLCARPRSALLGFAEMLRKPGENFLQSADFSILRAAQSDARTRSARLTSIFSNVTLDAKHQ